MPLLASNSVSIMASTQGNCSFSSNTVNRTDNWTPAPTVNVLASSDGRGLIADIIYNKNLIFQIFVQNEKVAIENTDENDPYADYQIPDDMMW